MNRYITMFLIFAICFVTIPYLTTIQVRQNDTPVIAPINVTKPNERKVRVMRDKTTEDVELEDYLTCCVLSMYPKLEEKESIIASASAVYTTYLRSVKTNKHNDNDVCDKGNCCFHFSGKEQTVKAFGQERYSKVYNIIKSEKLYIIKYNDNPINALIHPISSGKTEFVKDENGNSIPYLQAVESPFDKTSDEYISTVTFTKEQLLKHLKTIENACFGDNLQEWITDIKRTSSGAVLSASIGGVKTDVETIRKLLNLNSPCFSYRQNGAVFTFTVRGLGSQAGMSIYGAETMAKTGKSAEEILKHYYTNITLEPAALNKEPTT